MVIRRTAVLRQLTDRRVSRVLLVLLVLTQVLTGIPSVASAAHGASPTIPALESTPPPPPPQVEVNRTVPAVTPRAPEPQFSSSPTVQEIFRARIFPEPLVPIGGEPTPGENRVLAEALLAFHRGGGVAWESTLASFLVEHPASPWRPSLLANLGTVQLHAHAYSRALASWNEAWVLANSATDAYGKSVADLAMAEWLLLNAKLGQARVVESAIEQIKGRSFTGRAAATRSQARELAGMVSAHPESVLSSGTQALVAILQQQGKRVSPAISAYRPTAAGVSLLQLRNLARAAGLDMRMVVRGTATEVPVPSVVHWKVGHYSAVLEREGDRYRIMDQGFAGSYWMSRDTLIDEASGYFLVPDDATLEGWLPASGPAAAAIIGHSCPPGGPGPNDPDDCCGNKGLVEYHFQAVSASLHLSDTPVGYMPPRGPALNFRLTYRQRELLQPQIFTYANLGAKWTSDWLRFIEEVPADVFGVNPAHISVYLPGGGHEVFYNPDASGVYPTNWRAKATLVKVSESPVRYERRLPDGTIEAFTASDGGPAGQRRIFLSQITDPQGQTVTLTWDGQMRLVAITDAIGQVTTLAYDDSANPLRITKVTDPFNRTVTFTYNVAGQLASITDVIGLTSSIDYGPEDFVTGIRTPYGRTTFRHESSDLYVNRFVEATDPLGGTEHLEFRWETTDLPPSLAVSEVPIGFTSANANIDHYNTFYWSKLAWSRAPGDPAAATITKWVVSPDIPGGTAYSSGVPHSIKKPLESRVWFLYPGQVSPASAGSFSRAGQKGRVLDDGTSQIYETTYNSQGSILTNTDPLGRRTSYTYASNGVDLLEVRQTTGGMNDLLTTYANYNSQHRPQSIGDAAGQMTTLTYNAAGQPLTVTNAKNETTTSMYQTDGRLAMVTGPVTGATTSYTYDGFGRLRTATDSDGYVITTDYDVFDRPVRVTYPDASYVETTYDRLNVSTRRDRAGRITRYYYDPMARLTSTRDPAGRVVGREWCTCGVLDAFVDANGHRTRWERDVQGRVTREVRADNVTATSYTYGSASSRLSTVTDPKTQVTSYTYALDDRILSTMYTNAQIATPSVTYTYDAQYGRVATMTDGTGVTTYTYHQAGMLGAGQIASVDGPLTDDIISYGYDQLGRVTNRAINGTGNAVTWGFDALGRVTSEANVLGIFTYSYDGVSGRVAGVTYPNAQTSVYTYLDNAHDRRLVTIHHKYPSGETLSRLDYTYDVMGNILTWRQQADMTAVMWSLGYDAADQLTWAVEKTTDPVPTVLKTYMYAYDAAGNRTSEQIDDQLTGATYDVLNRLVSQQSAGTMVIEGTVSEPASVTVQGKRVLSTADGRFTTRTPVVDGTTTLTLTATDPTGNATTRQYEVDSTGAGRTFSYDANGNVATEGSNTFEWDAQDRLLAINRGVQRTEFTYDASHRRIKIADFNSGIKSLERRYVWCGNEICDERTASNDTVVKQFAASGEKVNGQPYFYSTDHLGSVRALSDVSGGKRATYTYEPYGAVAKTGGDLDATFGFTHHLVWGDNGLTFAMFRAYDPAVGRWIAEDPLGLTDGPNRYVYVRGRTLSDADPSGLCACPNCPGGTWVGSAAMAEGTMAIGKFAFGGLVFAGVLLCTSKPTVSIPFASWCAFQGGQTKTVHAGLEGGGAFMQCSGYKCSSDLEGVDFGGYVQVGPAFGFGETAGSHGCRGVGVGGGGGIGGGMLGCYTFIGGSF